MNQEKAMTDTGIKPSLQESKQRPSRKRWRDRFFYLHRYVGILVGIFAVIIGITGSLLIFRQELDGLLHRSLWYVQPNTAKPVSVQSMIDTVKAAYPDHKLAWIEEVFTGRSFDFWMNDANDKTLRVFVDQYTGQIIGSYKDAFFDRVLELHYTLLAGDVGTVIMGIAAGLLFLLCVTGLVLWPGWRKLATGFSIKWNAKRQRLNFDLHKVFGIIMVGFIAMTAFTGFCWNFSDQTDPILHAVTGVPMEEHKEPESTIVAGQSALDVKSVYDPFIAQVDQILPGGKISSFGLPTEEKGTFSVYKRLPTDSDRFYGSNIFYFDQYSGKLLKQDVESKKPVPTLGRWFLDSFDEVHYGTFWGIPSRIFYIFVGLAIPGLFVTGMVMYLSKTIGKKNKPRSIA
jgi:uncharacterized iron-regulated membrane protein